MCGWNGSGSLVCGRFCVALGVVKVLGWEEGVRGAAAGSWYNCDWE